MKRFFLYFAAFISVIIFQTSVFAAEQVSTFQELNDAISAAPDDGTLLEIVLTDNITLEHSIQIGEGKNISISSEDEYILKGAENSDIISVVGKFTLENNVILEGADTGYTGCGMGVFADGEFIMNGGKIRGNLNGGIWVQGVMTMNGGEISGNSANHDGAGVFLGYIGKFIMNDGKISNNVSDSFGGGVYVGGNCTFEMTGGEISGNTAGGSGGGVSLWDIAEFIMRGGIIAENTAEDGGGVYVSPYGSFTMSGGEISWNTASEDGGGIHIDKITLNEVTSNGTLTMTGGKISDNTADYYGGGIYTYDRDYANLNISAPAIFSGNKARDAFDYGTANKADYPNIDWASVSIPDTHLLNNYDINYTGGNPIIVPPNIIYISTEAELRAIADDLTGHYILKNDIVLTQAWDVLAPNWGESAFQGSLDGNGYSIYNVLIPERNDYDYKYEITGFFGSAKNAVIKNLTLFIEYGGAADFHDSEVRVGGLAAIASNTTIENCGVIGNIHIGANYNSMIGGLVAEAFNSTIKNSYSDVSISFAGEYPYLSAFADYVSGTVIENCYALGSISSPKAMGISGFVGDFTNSRVENCYSSVTTSASIELSDSKWSSAGAFATSSNNSEIINCYYNSDTFQAPQTNELPELARTTVQMKEQATFEDWGFDTIWGLDEYINNGFPYLLSMYSVDGWKEGDTFIPAYSKDNIVDCIKILPSTSENKNNVNFMLNVNGPAAGIVFWVAVYDNNNALIDLYQAATADGESDIFTITDVPKAHLLKNVKLMLWSKDTLEPYMESIDNVGI